MATTVKVTFTFDSDTIRLLEEAARQTAMAKSAVVREAIHEYHDRIGRLSERERKRLLKAFDELVPKIPLRPAKQADREIAELRAARKSSGLRRP